MEKKPYQLMMNVTAGSKKDSFDAGLFTPLAIIEIDSLDDEPKFNDALDEAEKYFDTSSQAFIRGLPRILFIEPMVVELIENGVEKNILIERYLVGDYKKVSSSDVFSVLSLQPPTLQVLSNLSISLVQ